MDRESKKDDSYRPKIPRTIHDRLEKEVKPTGRKVQDVIVDILLNWLNRNEGKDVWKM